MEEYDKLNKRILEIESKPSYDLFKKLYGSNISLQNELTQTNSRYNRLQELVFEKSVYVDHLYKVWKILKKPEIKIVVLLSLVDSDFQKSFFEQVLEKVSEKKYVEIDDVYLEYKSLIEMINKDDINHQILKNLFGHKKNKEDISDNCSIIDDEAYWKILEQYYYNLGDKAFLNPTLTRLKQHLIERHIVNASFKRSQLFEDLKQVYTICCPRKRR